MVLNQTSAADGLAGACAIKTLRLSDVQGFLVHSPDGQRYLMNKEDSNRVAQIYVGRTGSTSMTCITCEKRPNGPDPKRLKMQPHWAPSGKWIFLAVERDQFDAPPILGLSRDYVEGQLQSGLWTNMYVVSEDGMEWRRLTDFKSNSVGVPDGFTGPALTSDGKKAVWSQVIDGNVFKYWPFGRWQLMLADVDSSGGELKLTNARDITPAGMYWNEPGNFHPDNETLLLTGSDQADAQGMDQYLLNIRTGRLTNLTNSPTIWDEHGVFSPDGQKIVFMSAYPYRGDPNASKVLTIKTEFMLMNRDGSGLAQLTRFREPGAPEYSALGGIAATPEWAPDGRTVNLQRLFFPKYEYWDVVFQSACGNAVLDAAPVVNSGTVANGATYISGGLVPGSWAQLKGSNLSTVTRLWSQTDFEGLGNGLPVKLSGVEVKVNSIPAAVYFVSPEQVNFQVPAGIPGSATVQLIKNGVPSNTVTAAAAANAPGIFPVSIGGVNFAAAVFPDGKILGDPVNGAGFRKAKPGDSIQLFATGLAVSPAGVLPAPQGIGGVSIRLGDVTITPDFAGLVTPGLFQINFTVPQEFAARTEAAYPIAVSLAGVSSPGTINSSPPGPIIVPIQR